jgi:hypothetical protein
VALRPLTVAACSAALVIALSLLSPLFVYSDQARQLNALHQYLAGLSPSINDVVQADPRDLTRQMTTWIVMWPPSTQLAVLPLAVMGIPLGIATRIVAALALLAGAIGWTRWWSAFRIPRSWIVAAAILLPWDRYASNGLFQYSAEVLAFGCTPWVLAGVDRLHRDLDADRHVPWVRAVLLGLAGGALYLVKYSAMFITAGAIVSLVVLSRDRPSRLRVAAWFVAAAAIPVLLLSSLDQAWAGTPSTLAATFNPGFHPGAILYLVGNLGNIAADLDALLHYVLLNPSHPYASEIGVALLGVPGGLTLAWLLMRATARVERVAALVLATAAAALFAVWSSSGAASFEARHLAGATFAALPAALAIARRQWTQLAAPARGWLLTAAAVYLLVPWTYGPISAVAKARRGHGFVTGATHVYDRLAAVHDLPAAIAAFQRACEAAPRPVVWYVPESLTSLELHGPMVVTHADFEPLAELAARRYRGRVAVCALLPRTFERTGKGPAIRASFVDVSTWRRRPIPAAEYDLWLGTPR